MSGFFGFDAQLPERREPAPQQTQFNGFKSTNIDQTFSLPGAGEEEDLAVYTWGDGNGASLMEGGDEFNDDTFGGSGPISNDFQFSSQPVQSQTRKAPTSNQPRGPIASTQSRYKPRTVADPFAASEDDFYAARPTTKKPTKAPAKPKATPAPAAASVEAGWNQPPQSGQMWGASATSTIRPPPVTNKSGPPPPGQIKSLEEIEAEMSRVSVAEPPRQPQVLSLEEIEQQMLAAAGPDRDASPPQALQPPQPLAQPRISSPHIPTPTQTPGLPGSGYASQQALLDSMFPELGTNPIPGQTTAAFPGSTPLPPKPSPEEEARTQALLQRIEAKIASMARYNNLMGSSDKDFITRIQLSQLATTDPYTSDFYAQVFSALKRSRMIAQGEAGEGPAVVQIAPGFGLGVGAAAGNRFGKMGSNTMTKLSTQVKKLVENRATHQKNMGSAALQGALGKVARGGSSAPRPVLAVPVSNRPDNRPVAALNQQSGVRRQALTRKQVMVALEDLYDAVLDLEQARRDAPPPVAMEEVERWNIDCGRRVEGIWRRLMVMEPLDVSNPHPFVSLLNPIKGQKLFPRLIRHLPHQFSLTLLTLLIATYPQLDVVARAPPPPVADASLLQQSDRLDRARREAETDNFLHCVIPVVDGLINRCNLGLIAGLVGICASRMEVWKVAATRPGVALLTALLTRAQSIIRVPAPDPMNPQQVQLPEQAELEQWTSTYAYLLQILLPHLAELFPSAVAQKAAFGPGAYLLGGEDREREGIEMDRREAEVWGFVAALAVNAPEEEQTNLVGALREKILHTVQSARNPSTPPARAEIKLRNVNMFLNGLGLDASMIE